MSADPSSASRAADAVEALFRFTPFDWSGVSGVADVLMVLLNGILLASVIQAYRSVRASESARTADILVWAIGQMEEIKPDIAVARGLNRPPSRWTRAQREAAARVTVRLQRLAYMTRARLIDPVHFREMWAMTFVDMWDRLEPWVRELRAANGEPSTVDAGAFSRKDFELLARDYRAHVEAIRRRASIPPAVDAAAAYRDFT